MQLDGGMGAAARAAAGQPDRRGDQLRAALPRAGAADRQPARRHRHRGRQPRQAGRADPRGLRHAAHRRRPRKQVRPKGGRSRWRGSMSARSSTRRRAKVWEKVRDFNGLPRWRRRIRDSRIENGEPSDRVGCVRDFHLQNGDRIREQLLGLCDYDYFCTYSILESPMPLTELCRHAAADADHRWRPHLCRMDGRVRLRARGRGRRAGVRHRQNVFQAGFNALKRQMGADMVKVVKSTVIDAPVEAVWEVLRDFNGHDRWHPIVADSHVEAAARPPTRSAACAISTCRTARTCASCC
jgi:hypothetical protein